MGLITFLLKKKEFLFFFCFFFFYYCLITSVSLDLTHNYYKYFTALYNYLEKDKILFINDVNARIKKENFYPFIGVILNKKKEKN